MSNYSSLKATINANVKQNGNQEITGAIMNSVLNAMVDSLGAGYQYKGVATPATNPGTPDYNVFYLASEAGTYTNFGGLVIGDNEVAALVYNGSWSKQTTGAATASEVSQLAQEVTAITEASENIIKLQNSSFSVNGTTIETSSIGAMKITGTASSSGGRATRLCTPFTLAAGSYKMVFSVTPVAEIFVEKVSGDTIIAQKSSPAFTLDSATSVYIGANLVSGRTYSDDFGIAIFADQNKTEYIPTITAEDLIARFDIERISHEMRGCARVLHATSINFDNTNHRAEISPIIFSDPESSNARKSISATNVNYSFNQRDTTEVWLVYDIITSSYSFISAGTNGENQIIIACLKINGNSSATPNTSEVVAVKWCEVEHCYIDGENLETQVADLSQDSHIISHLLGGKDNTAELGALSAKTIYNGNVSASNDCLCSERYVEVLGGMVHCFHAADITVRISEYNSSKVFVKQTGYSVLKDVVLQDSTKYVRISAIYSGRGYGSGNPVSPSDFVDGDFGFTFPSSKVSEKVRTSLIENFVDEPFFVDGSTWKTGKNSSNEQVYSVRVIPVVGGKKLLVKSGAVATRIAFLNSYDKDYILANMPVSVDGSGNQNTAAGGSITMYTIPYGCAYIALSSIYARANSLPASLIIDGTEYMSPSVTDFKSVIEYFASQNDIYNGIVNRNITKDAAVRATGTKAVNADIKPFSFIHVSDIHTKSNNFKCFKNACEYYEHYGNIKAMIVTGDLVWDDFRDPMDYYNEALESTTKPVLNVIGNHDSGQWHVDLSSVSTDKQCYDKFIAPYVSGWGVVQPENAASEGKSYYYKDFSDEKVRLIVLCEFETDYQIDPSDPNKLLYSREFRAMRQAQVSWFIAALSSTPSDYGVVVALHQPLGELGQYDNEFVSFDLVNRTNIFNVYTHTGDLEWLARIIDAFARKTSLSLSVEQTGAVVTTLNCSCDFSNVEAELICVLCGHTHQDYVGRLRNYPSIAILCVGADNLLYTSGFQPRAEGTPSEDLFNVVNIDRNRKTIKIIRIGSDASVTGQIRDQMLLNYGTQSTPN